MKLFVWFRKHRATINGILITLCSSLAFNTISDTHGNLFRDFTEILKQVFEFRSLSGFLIFSSLVILVLINLAFIITRAWLNKPSLSKEFPELMKKFTSPHLTDSIGNGCISWGEGKTLEICNDIIYGWNPDNVLIDKYDDAQYRFFAPEEQEKAFGSKSYHFNDRDYWNFMKSGSFKEVIRKGNNLQRFMLKSCVKNYDKNNRKILLEIGRTEWSQTSYVWDHFGKISGDETGSNDLMKEYSCGIKSGSASDPFLPNSLCMHLLIETMDNKLILSQISESKRNDNPGTWAATLGEQLELEDFTDGNNYHDHFISKWMRRAFLEEYKMDDSNYQDLVDESSLKCISVNFESDRYNFSLFCTVQVRYTFEAFCKKVKILLSTDEASKLQAITLNDIPGILLNYNNPNRRGDYHPSTYLRLLLFYMHKYGYSKAESNILKAYSSRL